MSGHRLQKTSSRVLSQIYLLFITPSLSTNVDIWFLRSSSQSNVIQSHLTYTMCVLHMSYQGLKNDRNIFRYFRKITRYTNVNQSLVKPIVTHYQLGLTRLVLVPATFEPKIVLIYKKEKQKSQI